MTLPRNALRVWSERPGSILPEWTRSVVSDAVKAADRLAGHRFEIFVQGSYANETNIRGDSDVDLIVELKMPFQEDIAELGRTERKLFEQLYEPSLYDWRDFSEDVQAALRKRFWVKTSNKCLDIRQWDSLLRLPADVVPALEFRRYSALHSANREVYESGVYFLDSGGKRITSFPRQHLRNGRRKNRETGGRFKQVVRIVKNGRNYLGCQGTDITGTSSYLVECLLYNVDNNVFSGPLPEAYRQTIAWLNTERDDDWRKFVCQNEVFSLFRSAFGESHLQAARHLVSKLQALAL